ncbi:MAG: hypothetical protein AMXMBFR84_33090 [Candidatus Hydrogenedentota bacterium]
MIFQRSVIAVRAILALVLSAGVIDSSAFASEGKAAAEPGLTFHVSPEGDDANDGAEGSPFATLEKARDAIRGAKTSAGLPPGGVLVIVHTGAYAVRQTFTLTAADSGASDKPIIYRSTGEESPRFSGAVRLRDFRPVADAAVLERLAEEVRSSVFEADLTAVPKLSPFERGGFASGRGAQTHPAMELFVDDVPMTLARWPNEGFAETGEILGPLTLKGWDNKPGSPEGRFRFDNDRIARWAGEPDPWLYGYWYWNWADSYEKIEHIDPATREIVLSQPWHKYGYKQGNRFYAVNILSELDVPGEWYLDRTNGKIYLYPTKPLTDAVVELSAAPFALLELNNTSHVHFQELLWECGSADGIVVRGGEGVRLEGCTIRKMAGTGVEISGGKNHTIMSCDIHTMGRAGIAMAGGNRKTLTPGNHLIENCHIHHLSRIDHTYTPGVWLDGVGNRIRHNLFHDIASSAMRVEGNDHVIELNEAYRVVMESDDQGAVDMFGNPTYRGNVYRYNYWHHLGSPGLHGDAERPQRAGIRLDDAICGVLIHGNIFQRCADAPTHFGGVQIHGGKENIVESNLFVDCGAVVSFSPWSEERWQTFTAAALDDAAIDKELYVARYPSLAQLADGPNVNTVRSNVAIRCGELFLRLPQTVQPVENVDHRESTAFREGPDGRIVWSADEAAAVGLADIPFDDIGLYEDSYRTRVGHLLPLRGPR